MPRVRREVPGQHSGRTKDAWVRQMLPAWQSPSLRDTGARAAPKPPGDEGRNGGLREVGGTSRPRACKYIRPHLAAVLLFLLLLQQLGNRSHGVAGLERGLPGCARKEKAGPLPGCLEGRPRPRLQLVSQTDGGRRPRDSATIPEAPGKASGAPRAPLELPPPFPLPSILEPGKEAMRVLPSLRVTRKPLTTGRRQERSRTEVTPYQGRLEKDGIPYAEIYYSARVQDGGEP